jgi:hypothetical protein
MAELTVEQRVAKGLEWLDVNKPGWLDRINLTTFDLTDPCLCVLGQVFGDYWGSPLVREPDDWDIDIADADQRGAASLGFVNYPDNPRSFEDMRALEGEWRRVIEARREAASHE